MQDIGDYYRIAGAIINRYYPLIHMQEASVEIAREMLQRAQTVNVVQTQLDVDNLLARYTQWERLNNQVLDFPRFDIDYIRGLTVGIYQVNLAPGYKINCKETKMMNCRLIPY